ncbi:MAG: hypothetical protein A2V88_04800 [Elusimicrobia bacterium RBG_16_66_12]|nr:MAG: hypothetical protein A2V88_04800 [Elusimicrobia bacterium RBG_16_66_12]
MTNTERSMFSWAAHLRSVLVMSMPMVFLRLLALIFEFDNGPLENWWFGRHMGYPWSECVKHHRRQLVRTEGVRLPARFVAKLALMTIGPLIEIADLLSIAVLDWGHCREARALLVSWGRAGAFRGVPE